VRRDVRRLPHRRVDFLDRRGRQLLTHVGDDANDRVPVAAVAGDPLADRIARGPISSRERLIDDDDVRCVEIVAPDEEAPVDERDAHRSKVVLARDQERRPLRAFVRRRGSAFDDEAAEVAARPREERNVPGRADARDRRDVLQARQQAIQVCGALAIVRVLRKVHVDLKRQHVIGAEARIDEGELEQTPQHQAGADEQHERRRNLRDDERAAEIASRQRGPIRAREPRHE
jgi:hypothetical protein